MSNVRTPLISNFKKQAEGRGENEKRKNKKN